ncbi:hypothetical protein, partial [Staphylococcus pseudintermedius]|uniref:hypothetical protein n=1 Tax=Staphylococcus pseudintermedius TaxID=283734 RepID=UPI0018AB8DBB
DKDKTLNEVASLPWERTSSDFDPSMLKRVCQEYKINMDKTFKKLTEGQRNIILLGAGDIEIDFTFNSKFGQERNRTMPFEDCLLYILDPADYSLRCRASA